MKFISLICSFIVALALTACETADGYLIPEQQYSLKEIQRSIGLISGKPREISENQREIYSPYFARKPAANFDPNKSAERLYAHFWILGDRRPYDIRVQVVVERKSEDGYSMVGEDVTLSKKVADELQAKLGQSQDGSNVIDSFRPF